MNRKFRHRLQTMSEPERAVFDRARYRDLDYIQIAAELDISVDEVERLLSNAMRHLVGWKSRDR